MGDFKTFHEKVWSLMHPGEPRPTCAHCGAFTSLDGKRFREYCSLKCVANSDKIREKKADTCQEKYGASHFMKNKEFVDNFVANCHANGSYAKMVANSVNPFSLKHVREKIRKTNLERYGVENPKQSSEINERVKKTNLEKYGCESPLGNKEVQEKIRKTNLERYGVENARKAPEVDEKIRKTCVERYGVEHHMQNPEVLERVIKSQTKARYKYKSFVTPSGRTVYYRGHEKEVIEYCFAIGIDEDDVVTDRMQIPVVPYVYGGRNRMYFPDVFVKSKNLLLEVKSTYTFDREAEKNLAKQAAAKELGYGHIIVVWCRKNNCIAELI